MPNEMKRFAIESSFIFLTETIRFGKINLSPTLALLTITEHNFNKYLRYIKHNRYIVTNNNITLKKH